MVIKGVICMLLVTFSFANAASEQKVMSTNFLQKFSDGIVAEMLDDLAKGEGTYAQFEEQLRFFLKDGIIDQAKWEEATADANKIVAASADAEVSSTMFLQNFYDNVVAEMLDDLAKGEGTYAQFEEQLRFFLKDGYITQEKWEEATADAIKIEESKSATKTAFLQDFGQKILDEIMYDIEFNNVGTIEQAETQFDVMVNAGQIDQERADKAKIQAAELFAKRDAAGTSSETAFLQLMDFGQKILDEIMYDIEINNVGTIEQAETQFDVMVNAGQIDQERADKAKIQAAELFAKREASQ